MRTGRGEGSMVFPGTAWQEATPESQDLDSARLKAAVAYLDEVAGVDGAMELVIVRNGYLVWQGPRIDDYHPVWSCSKVFTSTVLGLLVDDGLCTPDTLAVEHVPGLDDEYPIYGRIKLRHLAAMTSGYQGEVGERTAERPWGEPMAYLIPAPPNSPPGAVYQYNDHGVHQLGNVLTRLVGGAVKDVFGQRIADPIGLTQWDWGVAGTMDGLVMNNVSGVHGEGIRTTARGLARVGLLYLNRGNWKGRQLLSRAWVEQATANQVGLDLEYRNMDLRGRYGFYWWTNGVGVSGSRPWPSAPAGAYTAHGHFCNYCFVLPEWNMVVVRMGTNPTLSSDISRQDEMWDTFFDLLAGALRLT